MRHSTLFTLLLAFTTPSFAQWDFVRIDDGAKPAIALGPDCTAEVSYMLESFSGFVRHARIRNGGLPAIATVDEGYFYGPLDVAASSNGDVYIAYHDHDVEDQVVARRSDDTWTLEPVADSGHDGWDNSILVTPDGVVHTSSVDPSGFNGRGVEYGRRSPNGAWNVVSVGSPSIMYAFATSIAIGGNGEPAIAYFNDTTNDLELAERSGNVWSTSVVDSEGDVGRFPSLAVDRNGDLHVAYLHLLNPTTGVIRYARRSDSVWSFDDVDTLNNVSLGFTGARRIVALEIDEDDQAHIVYGDRSVIKYATGTPGSWAIDTVVDESTTSTTLGQQVDMDRCNADGSIHLVYYVTSSAASTIWYAKPGIRVDIEDPPLVDAFGLSVYPNPSAGTVAIEVSGQLPSTENARVIVYDALGRRLLTRTVSQYGQRILLNDLVPGVYLVEARSGIEIRTYSFLVSR